MKNKILLGLGCCWLALNASVWAGTVTDLHSWIVEGGMKMDPSKPGPDGAPSFKIEPKAKAVLKLRPEEGAGKVTIYLYDDGTVASPEQQRTVGPRWGLMQADGRILVGAIMYAKFLQPTGSFCLIDTDPQDKNAWLAMKWLSPRGKAGWRKWEFDYDPNAGLKIKVDDKLVTQKYFDWNTSKATGFNGIILYGDDTPGGTAQTVWVGGITYELGGPMKVKPDLQAALAKLLPPAPVAVAVDEDATPFPFPGATLLDDLKGLKIHVAADYAKAHPRLLFPAQDRAAIQRRAKENPLLWDTVLASAKGIANVPTPEVIRTGSKYWRVTCVESAALAWFVTGDAKYRDGAVQWMTAHCQEPVWGTDFRPNLDLVASYYLYSISLAYDILYPDLTDAERNIIRQGLAQHARAICAEYAVVEAKEKIRYDQNHTYIPAVALTSAALALLDEVPDAREWLRRSSAVMRRCRYVLSEDGYYYEGFGYWMYALHWHVRYADLISRATGEKLYDLPALRDNWRFALHMSLPGAPGAFDVGDSNIWGGNIPRHNLTTPNIAMLAGIAAATGSRESQTAFDLYQSRKSDSASQTMDFLWCRQPVQPLPLEQIQPYQYFTDQDVVAWRSSWETNATCYYFRCGPPLGHAATAKTGQLKDWTMNCGHVHPDIGGFYLYAKGAFLAVTTGYTAEKWTRDHNTLLVDGKGQADDGAYHNERGFPYANLDQARIDSCYLTNTYGFASGEFGSAYSRQPTGLKLRRGALMTERWLLLVDDMAAPAEHTLTWLCHADAPFQVEGTGFAAHLTNATLAVIPLSPAGLVSKMEPTIVGGGATLAETKPGSKITIQRGYHLNLSMAQPAKSVRFVTLLVPLQSNEKLPEIQATTIEQDHIRFGLKWPGGKTEKVDLNLRWRSESGSGPATIKLE